MGGTAQENRLERGLDKGFTSRDFAANARLAQPLSKAEDDK